MIPTTASMVQRGPRALNVNVSLSLGFLAVFLHATLVTGLGPIHVKQHADEKGVNAEPLRGPSKTSRHRQTAKAVLSAITDLITRKGKVGLDAAEQEYVAEIKAIWTGDVIPGVAASIKDAQEEVSSLFQAILDCEDRLTSDTTGDDSVKSTMTTKGDELKICAELESDLLTEKDKVCNDFTTFKEELQLPAPLPRPEAGSQTKYDYLQQMNDYFCSTYETFEDKKQVCDDATKNYTDVVHNCTKLQGDFEQAACSLKGLATMTCSAYSNCYTQAVQNYQNRLKPLKDMEHELKEDAETSEKIQCLWESFDLEKPLCKANFTKVDECWTLKTDETNLTLVLPLPPDAKSCGMEDSFDMHPCTEEFVSKTYGSYDVVKAVTDRMRDACAECVEIEFPVTTTPTTTTATTSTTLITSSTSSGSTSSRICPEECFAPHCHHGNPWRSGNEMVPLDGKKYPVCPRTCSSYHGDSRYCGSGPNYEDEGSIHCVICVAPPTCPEECMEPTCANGNADNGGTDLQDGMCMDRCSRFFGASRYCGTGDEYKGTGSIDCRGCAGGDFSPSPSTSTTTATTTKTTTTTATTTTTKSVSGNPACNAECSKPTCQNGDPNNGGVPLVDSTCQMRCSRFFGASRYCGSGGDYDTAGSISCSACGPATTTTTTIPATCPDDCKEATCKTGSTNNGGIPLDGGRCTARCSRFHGEFRYCGKAGEHAYEEGDSVDCTPCKSSGALSPSTTTTTTTATTTQEPTTTKKKTTTTTTPEPTTTKKETTTTTTTTTLKKCNPECSSPKCVPGGSHNGGAPLVGSTCQKTCSRKYGGTRYCGSGSAYDGEGSISCTDCESGTTPAVCPSECKASACKEGGGHNGGIPLTRGKCTGRCSKYYGSWRYCGKADAAAYKDPDSIDCSPCKTASLATSFGAISTGRLVTCALRAEDASPLCWGSKAASIKAAARNGPYTQLSFAGSYGCGLQEMSGAVDCWTTKDTYGIKKRLPSTNRAAPFTHIATSDKVACALRTTGMVRCWGEGKNNLRNPPAVKFSAISMGKDHACGVRKSDGEVQCWGSQHGHSDKTSPPPTRGPYSSIAVGFLNSCAIRAKDSEVVCWGSDENDGATPPSGAFQLIKAADQHFCGLRTSGAIACWGKDEISSPPSGTFTDLSVGPSHSCAMTSSGKAKCWGSSTDGSITPPHALLLDEDLDEDVNDP